MYMISKIYAVMIPDYKKINTNITIALDFKCVLVLYDVSLTQYF